MKSLSAPLLELETIGELIGDIAAGRLPAVIDGCIDAARGHIMDTLSAPFKYRLIVTYNDLRARELYENYRFYDHNVRLYPAKDMIFYSADVHGGLIVRERLSALRRLLDGEPVTVVATVDALMDSILPREMIAENILTVSVGDILDLEGIVRRLICMGFERMAQVEGPGQFSVRGGIIDIYNVSDDCPYRIELWDDEVDSIRSFDVQSQRSIENCGTFRIYPASEFVFTGPVLEAGLRRIKDEAKRLEQTFREQKQPEAVMRLRRTVAELEEDISNSLCTVNIDSYINYFYEHTVSFLDYFDNEDSIVFLDEPNRMEEKGQAVTSEFREGMSGRLEKGYILAGQMDILQPMEALWYKFGRLRTVALMTIAQRLRMMPVKKTYSMEIRSIHAYNGNFEMLERELRVWKRNKYRVLLVSGSPTRARRLAADLLDDGLNAFFTENLDRPVNAGEIMVVAGNLSQGMEYPLIKFAVVAESDIFGEEKKKKRARKPFDGGKKLRSFLELCIGDYVVHESYGIGIYRGIEKIEVDHVEKDYIKIEYANGGNVYVLATQLDAVQKYADAGAGKPKINRLGSPEWAKTKKRVRGAVRDLASDLIKLYAVRASRQGFQFSEDTVWQREFEELFPYEETDDQLTAVEEVKADMESPKIMDRLLCGDVGYGKTEVAIRAAFKAVQDEKQVAFLVPTTILAQQHYNTFLQRMKGYPINIEVLSRFRTKAQQTETIRKLKSGLVDIVIGTHRILSEDVAFKDLGLLVVDEEQRFGVAHKERIKQMCQNVDVLTLTATPIPRTLHMSMIGIRDMSILEEPPQDRLPIQTYVMEYNEEMVREAILREIARGGQVYYVFNRVKGIIEMANTVSRLVPEAEVAYAHGQMNERELERIMFRFINGEIDVLVSTTIIETGLDISNVNTMIIHDADKLGMSQLYQLRGRVGRSSRMAYAFLLYRRNTVLREIAEKRLSAIREFSDLGSGFKIAMKDLEIRGAGNLLGVQQSGHIESVGYDLYCKLLGEAVSELKGEVVAKDFVTTVDMDIDAYIPSSYIRNEMQKLEIYKRIAAISCEEEYDEMTAELIDRYGTLPRPAINLLQIALIRALAHAAGIEQLIQRGAQTKYIMYPQADVDILKIPPLLDRYKNVMRFTPADPPYFTTCFRKMSTQELLKCEKNVIIDMKALIQQ